MNSIKLKKYFPYIKSNICISNKYCINANLNTNINWDTIINEAEKNVGYSTSFPNFRWLFNDELANIGTEIRKIYGTNHPLLKITKEMILGNSHSKLGLIILLFGKAAGINSTFSGTEYDKNFKIPQGQRVIAETAEMLKASTLIHNGILIVENENETDENKSSLLHGNKLAVLMGDHLLTKCFTELAILGNNSVQSTIYPSLRDLSEYRIIGLRDKQNHALPSRPNLNQQEINEIVRDINLGPYKTENILGNMKAEWTLRTILGGGSLLGYCCQSALILAEHDEKMQKLAYDFGVNFTLTWQASVEYKNFQLTSISEPFSLISAPVMFHLEYDPDFYKNIEVGLEDINLIDYDYLKKVILNGPALKRTKEVQQEYTECTLKILDQLPDNPSKTSLINLINLL